MNRVEGQERLEWLDILKGVAIFLVVLGHSGVSAIKGPIYAFHMPLFFMLAGYTAVLSYEKKKEAWLFAKKKLVSLFIPMVVWGMFGSLFFATRAGLLGYSPREGLMHCLTGDVMIWFIPALLCLQGLYLLYELAARKVKGIGRVFVILLLVAVLFAAHRLFGKSLRNDWSHPLEWLTNSYNFALPFIIGCFLRKRGGRALSAQAGGGVILALSIVVSLLFWRQTESFGWLKGNYCKAIVGSCISYSLIVCCAGMKFFPWFSKQAALIGKHTLIIYLASGIFQAVGFCPLAEEYGLLAFIVYGSASLAACYACILLSRFISVSPILALLLLGKPLRMKVPGTSQG